MVAIPVKTNMSYKMSHGDVSYSMVAIVNNTVLYIQKLLSIDIKSSHHKKIKLVTMCE